MTDDTRNGSSTVAPYQRWFDGYGNPIDPPDHTAEWLADNIRLRQENAELHDRIMQDATENARAIMESETIKAMQQEIRSLRQTIEALKSNAKVFDAASKEREKRLRDALEPFVTGAEDLHARGYVTYVTHEQVWEARQALEGSGER